jgi:hypothetical protein
VAGLARFAVTIKSGNMSVTWDASGASFSLSLAGGAPLQSEAISVFLNGAPHSVGSGLATPTVTQTSGSDAFGNYVAIQASTVTTDPSSQLPVVFTVLAYQVPQCFFVS